MVLPHIVALDAGGPGITCPARPPFWSSVAWTEPTRLRICCDRCESGQLFQISWMLCLHGWRVGRIACVVLDEVPHNSWMRRAARPAGGNMCVPAQWAGQENWNNWPVLRPGWEKHSDGDCGRVTWAPDNAALTGVRFAGQALPSHRAGIAACRRHRFAASHEVTSCRSRRFRRMSTMLPERGD